jgi:hypothetical protein
MWGGLGPATGALSSRASQRQKGSEMDCVCEGKICQGRRFDCAACERSAPDCLADSPMDFCPDCWAEVCASEEMMQAEDPKEVPNG